MIISTSSHSVLLTAEIDEFVHDTVRATLYRFQDRIDSVDVSLKDVNGPKGGVDKVASLRVHLRRGGQVITETEGENLYAAVRLGARKARRAVNRRLRKSAGFDRHRLSDSLPRGGALSMSSA